MDTIVADIGPKLEPFENNNITIKLKLEPLN